jgi:hypothetical protein
MTEPDTSTESPISPAPAQIDAAKDTAETYRPIEKAPPPKSPLFFIVFIIALGIIGYTGYTMYQNSQTRPNLKNTPTALPTVTVSTNSADITDVTIPEIAQNETSWPAFKNSTYTFTYPPQATIEPLNPGEGNGTYVFIKGPTQKPETEFFDGLSVRFRLVTDIGSQDLQDYV